MLDITVSGTGGASSTNPIAPTPVPTSTQGGALDTVSSSDTALGNVGLTSAGDISLKAYQGLMISTANDLQQMIQQINTDNATRSTMIYANAILAVQQLLQVITQLNQITSQEQTLYTQEQADTINYNSSVATYNTATGNNTSDQAQITTMNSAITSWQNANTTYNTTVATLNAQLSAHTITQSQYNTALATANTTLANAKTTYNNAVTSYNTYNTQRSAANATALTQLNAAKATYKSQVDDVENPAINSINAQLEQVGLPTLPANSNTTPTPPTINALPTPPAAIPIPTTALSYTPPTATSTLPAPTPPPSLNSQISQAMSQLTLANSLTSSLAKALEVYNNYNNYVFFNLQNGKSSIDPNAYIKVAGNVNKESSVPIGAGAGVSLGLLSTSLPNTFATKGLTTAINNQNYSDLMNIPPETASLAQFLLADLHTQSGLSAGTGALQIVGDKLATTEANSPLANLAIALAYGKQNSALVESNQLNEPLISLLQAANPGASSAHIAGAANQLSAQLKLSLLQSSLIAQSQALNFPELPSALVGLANIPTAQAALQASTTTTLNDALSDFLSKSAITNNLVANSNGEVSQQQAQNVVNDIANQVQQGYIIQQSQLNSSIQNSLIQQGVNESNAIALAAQTSDYINAEVNSSANLNASIKSSQLSQQNLATQLESQGINAQIAEQATVNALASHDLQTQRDLRDNLAQQLSKVQGQSEINLAVYIAANTTLQAQISRETDIAQQKTTASLSAAATDGVAVTDASLRTAIFDHAIAQGATRGIANQAVASILGGAEQASPTSLLNQVKEQVVALKATNREQEVEAFRSLIRPTFDAFVQSTNDLNPAVSVYHNVQTSIQMGSLQMPSNYKKELDFWA